MVLISLMSVVAAIVGPGDLSLDAWRRHPSQPHWLERSGDLPVARTGQRHQSASAVLQTNSRLQLIELVCVADVACVACIGGGVVDRENGANVVLPLKRGVPGIERPLRLGVMQLRLGVMQLLPIGEGRRVSSPLRLGVMQLLPIGEGRRVSSPLRLGVMLVACVVSDSGCYMGRCP